MSRVFHAVCVDCGARMWTAHRAECRGEERPGGVTYTAIEAGEAVERARREGFRAGVLACLGVLPNGGVWDDLRRWMERLVESPVLVEIERLRRDREEGAG